MIYGIGNDICDIRRLRATLERRGERFAETVLGPQELQVYQHRQARWADRGVRYLATRFSAKEAFSKAIGLGMRMPMSWRRCEILNLPSGQPHIVLHGDLQRWFAEKGLQAHVSITDESDYAASFVIVEKVTTDNP
ncbi:MAG: holo-ACP synthase [Brachymonas denitrificans]|jgi:holo-[acyl-carrier protein] synthase/beta-N-acetylhexosaminidase